MTEKRGDPHRVYLILDLIHLGLGIVITVLAVLAFISPEKHPVFFPLIFFLAAAVSLLNGILKIRASRRDAKQSLLGFGRTLFGAGLLVLGIVSALILL